MKKSLLIILPLISLVGLAGCAGGETSDSSTSSAVAYPTMTITPLKESYTVERLSTTTVRFKIETDDADASSKVIFTIDQENDGTDTAVITYDEDALGNSTEGVTPSLKITGNRVGTATITATCFSNPNVSASVTVEVTRTIKDLESVWKTVIAKDTNYTVETKRVLSEDEKESDDALADTESVPYSIVQVTDSAILSNSYTQGDDGNYTTTPFFTATDGTYTLNGEAADKNGYVSYLQQLTADGTYQSSEVIQTSNGLLKQASMAGLGLEATSPNDVGMFWGLQAINPTWLPSSKVEGNIYTLEGTQDDQDLAFAECLLWGMVDPLNYETAIATDGYFYTTAARVEVTVTALSNESVTFEIYEEGGYTDPTTQNTYDLDLVATITNVGTTTVDTAVTTYLTDAEAEKPALADDITLLREAAADNDYVSDKTYTLPLDANYDSTVKATLHTYFTPKYIFYYYDADYVTAWNKYVDYYNSTTEGKTNPESYAEEGGEGYMDYNGGIYHFTWTPETTTTTTADDGTETTTTTPASITVDSDATLTYNTNTPNFLTAFSVEYLSTTPFLSADYDYVYLFSTTPQTIWSNDSTAYHYSNSIDAFDLLLAFNGISSSYWPSEDDMNACVSGFSISTGTDAATNKDVATSVTFTAGYNPVGSQYYSVYSMPTISKFGEAEANNPADATIQAKLAETTTTTTAA